MCNVSSFFYRFLKIFISGAGNHVGENHVNHNIEDEEEELEEGELQPRYRFFQTIIGSLFGISRVFIKKKKFV
jgi:hypothetical protein